MKRRQALSLLGGALASGVSMSALGQYVIPEGQVRLVFNENPYGPSPKAIAAVNEILSLSAYYPDSPTDFPILDDLMNAISKQHNVGRENLLVSSGSNEALQAAVLTYGKLGKVLVPALTYDAHLSYAKALGVDVVSVPLRDDLQVDLDAMKLQVDDTISLVYLANPNNPTGIPIDAAALREFCREVGKKAVIIIDEAYNELTDNPAEQSMVDLVRDHQNVLITRTFSKIFGMAGMRVGYGIGHPEIIARVNSALMAWPNGIGLTAAYHSYEDEEFIAFSRQKILEGRAMVNATLQSAGVIPVPSQTNFVFADIGVNAAEFVAQMARRNVQIRGGYTEYPHYIRVSMGKLEDLKVFDRVFRDLFRGKA